MLNPNAGPFAAPQTLAEDTTSVAPTPLQCSDVEAPSGAVRITPNPIPTCIGADETRTETHIFAYQDLGFPFRGDFLELRVGSADGPAFHANRSSDLGKDTGDWVRNGMRFYLTRSSEPGVPLAARRAYLLPVQDCRSRFAPPLAGMRTTRDCRRTDTFTIAYSSGGIQPVEIRRFSSEGEVVARLSEPMGLLDVTASASTSYHLMVFTEGKWKDVASAVADPRQPCGQ